MKRGWLVWLLVAAVGLMLAIPRMRTSAPVPAEAPTTRIRVEVLNAAGISRLAQRGTDHLRDAGFDVVYYGNAQGFSPDSSVVILRGGERELAESVAESLGLTRIIEDPDSSLYLEVTVVLGKDWGGK